MQLRNATGTRNDALKKRKQHVEFRPVCHYIGSWADAQKSECLGKFLDIFQCNHSGFISEVGS